MFKLRPEIRLILASQSPRRRELLSGAGICFEVVPADILEDPLPGELADQMVSRLALEKARVVAALHSTAWVIGADTTVVVDGKILGKPVDHNDATRMLTQIQGRTHEVWGGISLCCGAVHSTESFRSVVTIAPLSPEDIERYIQTNEPMDKAGSYAIQGIGAALVQSVEGSYTNVVGLDLAATIGMLRKHSLLE